MPELGNNINIICLESDALKALVKKLSIELRDEEFPWVDEKEAMLLLRINSKTTFQKYRDNGQIEYRKLSSKHIVYRRKSILDFIENSGLTEKSNESE
ncbi:MAG: hypothetical protein Sapg2KO_24500 [Saprospiraceae bacterium]